MEARVLLTISVIWCLCAGAAGQNLYNPAGPPTVPPSSVSTGNAAVTGTSSAAGNLIVTGNVTGGKHFRGIVPYRSSTYFRAGLGSSALDSFLRYSAGSENLGFTGSIQPFYSPSRSVSATSAAWGRLIRPTTSQASQRLSDRTGSNWPYTGRQVLSAQPFYGSTAESFERFYLSRQTTTGRQTSGIGLVAPMPDKRFTEILTELRTRTTSQQAEAAQSPTQPRNGLNLQQLRVTAPKVPAGRQQLRQLPPLIAPGHITGDLRQQPQADSTIPTPRDTTRQLQHQPQLTQPQPGRPQPGDTEQLSPPPAIQQPTGQAQFDQLLERYMQRRLQEQPQTTAASATIVEAPPPAGTDRALYEKADVGAAANITPAAGQAAAGYQVPADKRRAQQLIREAGGFDAFVRKGIQQQLRAGRTYLQQGRYYKAADAYTLASAYVKDHPLALAGKSHALLGAGEYIGSALFLTRAVEALAVSETAEGTKPGIFKQLAASFVLLDRDTVDMRVGEMERFFKEYGSPELQFLLGYVYYQLGRFDHAAEALKAAAEKMPDVPAAAILAQAAEAAPKHRQPGP